METEKSHPLFWDSLDQTQRILLIGLTSLVIVIFCGPIFLYKLKVHDCMEEMRHIVDSRNRHEDGELKIACLKVANGSAN